jgi:hypothetical protein
MSKAVKVFFSQPMHGLTDEEIKLERTYMRSEFRDYIINELGFDDDVVIQDVNYNFDLKGPDGCGRLWYLGRSIQAMDEADYIVFHKDYIDANGCCVERSVARNYFKPTYAFFRMPISDHIHDIFAGNLSHDT